MFDDVASQDECDHVIALANGRLEAAKVVDQDGQLRVNPTKRAADIAWIYTNESPVMRDLVHRVAKLAQLPASHCERIQVVHYEVGGQHSSHIDAYESPKDDAVLAQNGQRLKTGLLYLQAPMTGGGTSFPKARAKVAAKTGRLALFDLVEPGTTTADRRAVHSGNAVVRGEKWACNFWFCERAANGASRPKPGTRRPSKARKKRR